MPLCHPPAWPSLGRYVLGGQHRHIHMLARGTVTLGARMTAADPLSDHILVQWALGSFLDMTTPGLIWLECASGSWKTKPLTDIECPAHTSDLNHQFTTPVCFFIHHCLFTSWNSEIWFVWINVEFRCSFVLSSVYRKVLCNYLIGMPFQHH